MGQFSTDLRGRLHLAEQLRLAGRDPAPVHVEPALVRRYLVRTDFAEPGVEGLAALVAELRERAQKPGVTVAPGALVEPPAASLSAAEKHAYLAAVLAQLDAT